MLEVKKANIKLTSGATRVEPAEYLKRAEVDGNTLTLTNKDDSVVEFTPQGGGGADVPVTTNLLKGDGNGNIVAAVPNRDYIDYDRDKQLSMVKSGFRFTARTDYVTIAGNKNEVHGGTVDIKGYQEIEMNAPSATLNGKDIAVVDDIGAAAGNWYHYDWGNRGIMKYDYLIDGSSITDWEAATSLPSFRSPALTLGADLFTIIYQLDWSRAHILELRPQLIQIFNLLKEHELLSVDAVIYTVRESLAGEPTTANFGKVGNNYHFIQSRYDGSSLIAEWAEGAADFSSFQIFYGSYPYADSINLSADRKAAIQANLGIVPAPTLHNYSDLSELNLAIEDNQEYNITSCNNVTLTFPNTNFESHITFNFDSSFNVTFPSTTRYIGGEPQFTADSVWEVSIKNGIVVAGEAE